MKTNISTLLLILAGGLAQAAETAVLVGPGSSGKTVDIQPGQTMAVELPGNPTTGYEWTLTKLKGKALEKLSGPEYRPSKDSEKRVGAGGTYVTVFLARSVGSSDIQLDYHRSWEKKESEQVFKIKAVCSARPVEAVFVCPDGSKVIARFLNDEKTMRYEHSGRKARLKQALSASGARYAGADIEFWNKGEEAVIKEGGKEFTCRTGPRTP